MVAQLKISSQDVKRLVSHPDRDVRAVLAQKVCREIKTLDTKTLELSEYEGEVVKQILWLIARDTAAMVRRALAVTLKNSLNLPQEIARKLIRDVDSIAVPILAHSPVLNDEDLLEVLKSKAAAKLMAVSKRAHLGGDLVKAIIRYGDSRVVASVAANDGAEIGAELGAKMLDIYRDDDLIKDSFIARRDLPPLVIEKLLTIVSAEAARRLYENHEVPLDIAVNLANRSRERASVDFIAQSWISRDLKSLIERLDAEDRLTNSLIVRAACCGQMRFCEQALAQKSGVGLNKAALMIHDSGPFGLKALCTQAGLYGRDAAILRASIVIYRDLERTNWERTNWESAGKMNSKRAFQTIMLERVLSLPITFSETDTDYLMDKLDALAA
ncbi:MAG: DUF2336 domain-containing protein [Robiginitomaculum sp.]|nr:DUF2336 domain-containing protein [Robiginitomaculum sp.]